MNKWKITVMIVVLGAVIIAIMEFRKKEFAGGTLLTSGERNWCPTRVKTLANNGENVAFEQEGTGWKVTKPQPKNLDPTFIEKWLAANCKIAVDGFVNQYVLPGGQTELDVTFIDGTSTKIMRTEPRTFVHQGDVFRSTQFEEAWHSLNQAAR